MHNKFQYDEFVRMKQLASYSEKPETTHTYKSGINKGKTKVISARRTSHGLIGVSEKTIWQWVKEGKFPAPIRLSANITVWRLSDVQAWMENKASESAK